jgi:hypothetical protein
MIIFLFFQIIFVCDEIDRLCTWLINLTSKRDAASTILDEDTDDDTLDEDTDELEYSYDIV